MKNIDARALPDFARRTAKSATDFASVILNLIMDVRDTYRPELHYMRGPGPRWRARHRIRPGLDCGVAPLARRVVQQDWLSGTRTRRLP